MNKDIATIKTFPLKLSLEFHKKIKLAAAESEKTIEFFIVEAIKEKLIKDVK